MRHRSGVAKHPLPCDSWSIVLCCRDWRRPSGTDRRVAANKMREGNVAKMGSTVATGEIEAIVEAIVEATSSATSSATVTRANVEVRGKGEYTRHRTVRSPTT